MDKAKQEMAEDLSKKLIEDVVDRIDWIGKQVADDRTEAVAVSIAHTVPALIYALSGFGVGMALRVASVSKVRDKREQSRGIDLLMATYREAVERGAQAIIAMSDAGALDTPGADKATMEAFADAVLTAARKAKDRT